MDNKMNNKIISKLCEYEGLKREVRDNMIEDLVEQLLLEFGYRNITETFIKTVWSMMSMVDNAEAMKELSEIK